MRYWESGFSYIGLLLLIAIIGAGLAVIGQVWHTEVKRENERELLFVGEQFRQAITNYYNATPSVAKQFPPTLEALLQDQRLPVMRRYLRKIYTDPMTKSTDWGLVKEQGRIVGVFSKAQGQPLIKVFAVVAEEDFKQAKSYQDWRFFYRTDSIVPAKPSPIGELSVPSTPVPATNLSNHELSQPPLPPVVSVADDTSDSQAEEEPPPDEPPVKSCDRQAAIDYASCYGTCNHGATFTVCIACYTALKQKLDACRAAGVR